MTGYGWLLVGGFSAVWITGATYFFFFKKRAVVTVEKSLVLRDDKEVIVSNTKIMINVLFAEDEKIHATPDLLADFVISFKDIVKGTYSPSPGLVKGEGNSEIENVQSVESSEDPGVKEPEGEQGDNEVPDLSDAPELPEIDENEQVPSRDDVATSQLILDEAQLVDSNALNLNMSNQ